MSTEQSSVTAEGEPATCSVVMMETNLAEERAYMQIRFFHQSMVDRIEWRWHQKKNEKVRMFAFATS